MARRATIGEVAALAGVHKGTVSRALNAKTRGQVNPATVLRVQQAVKQLGYVPNIMARGLRTNSSMTIGVVIPDLTNPFFPPIIRGIEEYLAPRGYTALLANTDSNDASERAAYTAMLDRRVDGFIFATGVDDHSLLHEATDSNVFAVLVNRDAIGTDYPLVTGDDETGVAAAVRHLADLGHRSLVHITGDDAISTNRVRSDAFSRACSSDERLSGVIIPTEDPRLSVEAGQQAMDELIRSGMRGVTAVTAANDQIAIGVLRAMRAHGIACPDDVSVIGFNDIPYAEDLNPALTTVRVPLRELGVEASRLLLAHLEAGAQSPVRVELPVALVLRDSTGPAPR